MCPILLSLLGGSSLWDPHLCLAQGSVLGSPVLSVACILCGQPSPPVALQVPADQPLSTDFYLQADLPAMELSSHKINH